MAAFDLKGHTVNIGDQISIIGVITAVGSGSNPTVTVQPPLSANTFTVNAQDITTYEGTAPGPARGNSVIVGNDCTTTGIVTGISGSGNTATLTVQAAVSGDVISAPSGASYVNQ